MRIRTPNFPAWSKKTTSGHFRPCTGAINTTLVKEARVARWLEGATSLFTCRPAYQMSADGVTWGTVTGIGALSATAGWVYDDGPVTSITTDQQLFVRFGVEGANVSGALVQQGTCALDLDLRPVVGGSLAASEVKVFTSGSTSTRVFHPLLSGVAFEDITELRSTVQVESGSGAILAIAGWQLSDDGLTWYDAAGTAGAFTTFGGEQTNDGTTYGTTFATQTVADGNKRRKVRFGVGVKNQSGTNNETALVSLRVDYRRTT
jgi:hypothetical protein